MTNEIRSDALNIQNHERICDNNNNNCNIKKIKTKLGNEIKIAILKKAAFLEKNKLDKIRKKNKDKPYTMGEN